MRSDLSRRRLNGRSRGAALAALLLGVCGPSASTASGGVGLPAAGELAPAIELTTVNGDPFVLAEQRPWTTILLFGELYNPNTVAAGKDVAGLLAGTQAGDLEVRAFIIVSQNVSSAALLAAAAQEGVSLPIVHDPDRRAMGSVGVRVLPTLVVVDPAGLVTIASSGYPVDFVDLVTDALYLAGGQITAEQYERRRETTSLREEPESHRRALRLAALGDALARRGSAVLAIKSYEDAISEDPSCIQAHLGLGQLRLARGELVLAEEQFIAARDAAPDTLDATLGLLQIEMLRAGSELSDLRGRVVELMREHPFDARLEYLAGRVAERVGDTESALQHFRRASELSLFGQVQYGRTRP